jgi:hypothetical protein
MEHLMGGNVVPFVSPTVARRIKFDPIDVEALDDQLLRCVVSWLFCDEKAICRFLYDFSPCDARTFLFEFHEGLEGGVLLNARPDLSPSRLHLFVSEALRTIGPNDKSSALLVSVGGVEQCAMVYVPVVLRRQKLGALVFGCDI